MLQTTTITVRGKVQGVFFRQSTREKAIALGITGFVQNLPDKTVFITATGTREQLDALLDWCHTGPDRAVVSAVESTSIPLHEFDSFRVRRTDD